MAVAGLVSSVAGALFGQDTASKQADAAAAAAAKAKKIAKKQNKIIDENIKPAIKAQGEAQTKASEESRKAEALRELQMNLDAQRTRRDIIRNMVMAQSIGLTRATAQGASAKDSGVMGGLSQITAEGTRQTRGVNQNVEIGTGIFTANRKMSEFITEANKQATKINWFNADIQSLQNKASSIGAQSTAQIAQIGASDMGGLFTSIGGSILSTLPSLSKLGTSALFGSSSAYYSTPNNGYFYDFATDDPFYPVFQ